ncbi:MAG TPA: glycosyltransferase family 4 protein [Thermoleophilaceae bacterium]|nr:glycosyltransferase family 4 protein [Thermoleophilaceae bacterium]
MAATGVDEPVPITFVISHALSGGSERYLELLLDHLEPAWVRSIVSLQDGPFVARLRAGGYRVDVIPTGARLSMVHSAWRLRRLLRAAAPAAVHANGVKAALVCALAMPRTGIPLIWVKHDFSWDGPLAHAIASRCDQVVGVSAAVTGTFRGGARRRVHVVHNGTPELVRDRAAGRELVRELVGSDGEVVLLVGRFHPAKGQIELVEAAPRVLERRPGTRLLLLGGEDPYQLEYARAVRARIEELGLGDTVVVRDHHPDAPGVMAGSDVVAVPSVPDERGMGREGFGLVGIEAMAVGTPVVGYDGGALPEVLGDAAVLVPEGDRAALAEAIVHLLSDRLRREALVERGRVHVAERFSLDATVEGMRERYRAAARGALVT